MNKQTWKGLLYYLYDALLYVFFGSENSRKQRASMYLRQYYQKERKENDYIQ